MNCVPLAAAADPDSVTLILLDASCVSEYPYNTVFVYNALAAVLAVLSACVSCPIEAIAVPAVPANITILVPDANDTFCPDISAVTLAATLKTLEPELSTATGFHVKPDKS